MKRFLSLILVAALTLSLALALGACGKNKEADNTTAAEISDAVSEDADVSVEETESKVVHTTDEHYEEDYEELTLPPAISTTKANETTTAKSDTSTTTKKTESKVTTTKQSLVTTTAPTTKPTTTKPTTTKKGEEPTTMFEINTELFSQTVVITTMENQVDEHIGFGGGVGDVTEVPRPNVTYYDKFVTDVLNSGSYTYTRQVGDETGTAVYTIYADGGKTATKVESGINGIGISFRMFTKDGKGYIIIPTMLSYFVTEEMDGFEGIEEALSEFKGLVDIGSFKYCGLRTGTGYVCESYMDPESTVGIDFYFSSVGLTKMEVVDLETKERETIVCSLKSGVKDNSVFSVPAGYNRITEEEAEKMLEGTLG